MATTTVAAPRQAGIAARWYSTSTVLTGLSIALLGAAHIAAGLQYLSLSAGYSLFFFVVGPAQLLYGLVLLGKVRAAKSPRMLLAALAGTLALVGLWLFAHVGWQPLFPAIDGPEALSELNVLALFLAVVAAVGLLVLLPKANNLRRDTTWTVLGLSVAGWLTLLVVGFL